MPRIFNAIRQRLLKENRLTRYLVYAVGEIVLVVIGILIALQVNTWNLTRQDRQKETKYLAGLKADLQVDLVELQNFMQDKEVKRSSAVMLLSMEDPVTAEEVQRMDSIIWRVFEWRKFVPSTKTLDELTGSGNLSLITNDSIKAMMLDVSQHYAEIGVYIEHMRREYDHYLYDRSAAMREMAPFADLEHWAKTDTMRRTVSATEAELAALTDQTRALLHDLSFRNGLKLAALNNRSMWRRCQRSFEKIEHLIALIDLELNTP
ncbi:MAG: hypothetical protein JNL52_08715 [Flavobacteriales bacterium]|nr:hypothetical protein [Flavobacteriales bacterium]